jgi:hypothetical protein
MKIYLSVFILLLHTNLIAQQKDEAKMIQINEFNFLKNDIDFNLGFGAVIIYKNKLPNTYSRLNFGTSRYIRERNPPENLTNITFYTTAINKTQSFSIGFGEEFRQALSANFYAVVGADVGIDFTVFSYKSIDFQMDTITKKFVTEDRDADSYIASIIKAAPYLGLRFMKNRFAIGAEITGSLSYSSYVSSVPKVQYASSPANFRMMLGYRIWK